MQAKHVRLGLPRLNARRPLLRLGSSAFVPSSRGDSSRISNEGKGATGPTIQGSGTNKAFFNQSDRNLISKVFSPFFEVRTKLLKNVQNLRLTNDKK